MFKWVKVCLSTSKAHRGHNMLSVGVTGWR